MDVGIILIEVGEAQLAFVNDGTIKPCDAASECGAGSEIDCRVQTILNGFSEYRTFSLELMDRSLAYNPV